MEGHDNTLHSGALEKLFYVEFISNLFEVFLLTSRWYFQFSLYFFTALNLMVPTANISAKTCRHKALNAVVILNEIKKIYGPKKLNY